MSTGPTNVIIEDTRAPDDPFRIRDELLKNLKEDDTEEVANLAANFGTREEFYCLYVQKFWFKPWWYTKGIEFRPFRNVRIHRPHNATTFQKIGYYSEWLLEPAFTRQVYNNGKACDGGTKNTTTYVTYQCGMQNRIASFKEIAKCETFELVFQTPLKCEVRKAAKLLNQLAIADAGKESWNYMYVFGATVCIFIAISYYLYILKKKRIY